jgi:hypothetical protein
VRAKNFQPDSDQRGQKVRLPGWVRARTLRHPAGRIGVAFGRVWESNENFQRNSGRRGQVVIKREERATPYRTMDGTSSNLTKDLKRSA